MTEIDAFALASPVERGLEYARRLVRDFNLSPEQAAGLVGNLLFESDGFAALQERHPVVPGSRGGCGVAMWTGDRRVNFEEWAAAASLDANGDPGNYGFLCFELRGAYKGTIDALRGCQTVEQAVWSVGQTYERPGGTTQNHLPGYSERLHWAQQVVPKADSTPKSAPAAAVVDTELLAVLIEAVQRVLGDLYEGDYDGIFGPQTSKAIEEAQKANR